MTGRRVGVVSPKAPLRTFQSNGLIPTARTRIRTCPDPGRGSSTSTTCRTLDGPYSEYRNAFTVNHLEKENGLSETRTG
jgi:hypothetical protein